MLVEKHVVNDSTQYSEIHHIIPKCMGGGDSSDNLVRLSPEAMFKRRTATWNKNPAWKNAIEYFDLWILSNRPSAGVFKRKILQDRTEKCDQIIQLFHSGWVPALCDIYCSWVINTNSSIDKD